MEYKLNELKELSTSQYDMARDSALKRIRARVGEKPSRKDFRREYAPLWTTLDILALVIFFSALAVSSLHIMTYAGSEASISFRQTQADQILGVTISSSVYGLLHQAGLLAVAESAMLLFFVMFRIGRGRVEQAASLLLAIGAMVFVIVANLASGLNTFISLLVPAFTIGIGFRLEDRLAEMVRRNAFIDESYQQALEAWMVFDRDPTKHPDYLSLLAVEVWQKLVSYKVNAAFAEAPPEFRREAVLREFAKDQWAQVQWGVPSPGQARTQKPSISRPLSPVLDTQDRTASGQRNTGHGTGYEKNMSAPEIVRRHLEDNPEDMDLSVRELGERLGVGKSTVHNVMKEMRSLQTNGHGSNGNYGVQ